MKKFYVLFGLSVFTLVIGLLLGKYLENFRGINPYYAIGKMISWGFVLSSPLISLITLLFVFFTEKDKQPNFIWKILISLPLLSFIFIFTASIVKSI